MLAAIFLAEAGFLAFAFVKCSQPMPGNPVPLVNERCPKLGERSETLFIAAITTTLSLLTGAGVAGATQRKPSVSDPALPSDELPRQLPRRRSQAKSSSAQEKAELPEQSSLPVSETQPAKPHGKR